MRVEHHPSELAVEPRRWVQHEQGLVMALRPGWVEAGQRRSEMKKINVEAGEMGVWGPRPLKTWDGAHVERLILTISDPALRAASGGISDDVELGCVHKLADARLGALVAAVNAERAVGFPSGRLFLDSIEQALAVTLVNKYAVRRPSPRIYRGGLTPARLRKVLDLVHAARLLKNCCGMRVLCNIPAVLPWRTSTFVECDSAVANLLCSCLRPRTVIRSALKTLTGST